MKKSILRVMVALLLIIATTVITSSVYAATLNVDNSVKYKAGDTVTVTVNYENQQKNTNFTLHYDIDAFEYKTCTSEGGLAVTAVDHPDADNGRVIITAHDGTNSLNKVIFTFAVKANAPLGTAPFSVSNFVVQEGASESITVNVKEVTITHATHNYSNITTTPATCTAAGSIVKTCACGESITESIPKLAHNYNVESTTPATCTATGSTVKVCALCGDRKTETIAKIAHNYNVESTTPATCTATGSTVKVCTACGDRKTETIAKIAHNYKDGVCTVCGEKQSSSQPSTGGNGTSNPAGNVGGSGNANPVVVPEGEKPTMLPQTGIPYVTIMLVIVTVSFSVIIVMKRNKR